MKMKSLIASFVFVAAFSVIAPFTASAAPLKDSGGPASSTTTSKSCNTSLFLIPAWYDGLLDGNCNVREIGNGDNDLRDFIVRIAINIIRAGFIIAGYASVFFIIKGGFLFILARGEPANITAAKTTITNAVIGLIICVLAAAIVSAVGNALG